MTKQLLLFVGFLLPAFAAGPDDWPRWRGPYDNGMARGDAPVEWSDTRNIAWKLAVPGKGNSSPVVWGDKLFLTTAVPMQAAKTPSSNGEDRKGPGGAGGGTAGGVEHRFVVMCIDRKT